MNDNLIYHVRVSNYALAGGMYVSASSWQDPPQGPPARRGATPSEQRRVQNGPLLCKPWHQIPHNLKGCGGGVNSPMNDYNTDAKALFTIKQLRRDAMMTIGSVDRVIMNIGALHEAREQKDVYQNSNDSP